MSLNINTVRQSGFTIVELLIVVVVIAILAAITIVSYNGITAQANHSAAKSTAATVQKKAELYYSVHSDYPASIEEFDDSDQPYHLTGSEMSLSDPDSNSGKNTVKVAFCGAGAGMEIYHYNYEGTTGVPGTPQITLGDASGCED